MKQVKSYLINAQTLIEGLESKDKSSQSDELDILWRLIGTNRIEVLILVEEWEALRDYLYNNINSRKRAEAVLQNIGKAIKVASTEKEKGLKQISLAKVSQDKDEESTSLEALLVQHVSTSRDPSTMLLGSIFSIAALWLTQAAMEMDSGDGDYAHSNIETLLSLFDFSLEATSRLKASLDQGPYSDRARAAQPSSEATDQAAHPTSASAEASVEPPADATPLTLSLLDYWQTSVNLIGDSPDGVSLLPGTDDNLKSDRFEIQISAETLAATSQNYQDVIFQVPVKLATQTPETPGNQEPADPDNTKKSADTDDRPKDSPPDTPSDVFTIQSPVLIGNEIPGTEPAAASATSDQAPDAGNLAPVFDSNSPIAVDADLVFETELSELSVETDMTPSSEIPPQGPVNTDAAKAGTSDQDTLVYGGVDVIQTDSHPTVYSDSALENAPDTLIGLGDSEGSLVAVAEDDLLGYGVSVDSGSAPFPDSDGDILEPNLMRSDRLWGLGIDTTGDDRMGSMAVSPSMAWPWLSLSLQVNADGLGQLLISFEFSPV
ncbi:MAG: hypothetical protein AAGE59_15520 [Cyanobacteria bacterium P01_F01_bin.86]